MNGFEEKTRILYGVVCIIGFPLLHELKNSFIYSGYGLGLIITFLALTLMNMAQPALIYLVPSTLAPICLIALFRGEFLKMWNGVPESDNKTSEQSQVSFSPLFLSQNLFRVKLDLSATMELRVQQMPKRDYPSKFSFL